LEGDYMQPAVCIEMLFPGDDEATKIEKIAGSGFRYIEFWGFKGKDMETVQSVCKKFGVQVVNMSGHRKGDLINKGTHGIFLADLKDTISAAKKLGCTTLMLLTNELGEGGRVLNPYPELSESAKNENLKEGLRKALKEVPDEMKLVLEPLNTRIDHPGYFLTDMENAVKIINEVGSPQLKVLCDLYHLGVMGLDLKEIIRRHVSSIGYVHIADIPGRHEPGTGSVDWPSLLQLLHEKGYNGYVGFEYEPLGDSNESLHRIRRMWDSLKI